MTMQPPHRPPSRVALLTLSVLIIACQATGKPAPTAREEPGEELFQRASRLVALDLRSEFAAAIEPYLQGVEVPSFDPDLDPRVEGRSLPETTQIFWRDGRLVPGRRAETGAQFLDVTW